MPKSVRDTFLAQLATPLISEQLFAQVPDIVFCIKNLDHCYISANRAFADRIGLRSEKDIIGKHATDFFPEYLAEIYTQQDLNVFSTQQAFTDKLELINNRSGGIGWYLASKLPLFDKNGTIIGLASISRDLLAPNNEDLKMAGLAKVVDHIQAHFGDDLKPAELAKKVKLSATQLDRKMKKIFKLSASQFIRKTRIEAAAQQLISSKESIANIALDCGYGDQSAFTRQFKATVGMTPGDYRTR